MVPIYCQLFPHGDDSEPAKAFYEAIGRNVVLWGRVENTMDYTMMQIMGHPKAVMPKPRKMPNAFSEKIKLWVKLFESEPLIAHHRRQALRFAKQAEALSDRRHELIHAVIHYFDKSIEGASALHFKHSSGKTTAKVFEVRTAELNKLLDDITGLYYRLSVMAITALFLKYSPNGLRVESRNGQQVITSA